MQTFTTILAASAFIASVSGSPLKARNTCGSAPSSSGSQTPISQPTGIATAAACQDQCDANSSCQSFVFGLVDGTAKCMLYSVAAASVPKQSSTALVAYDKACTSVPTTAPTTSNTPNQNHKLAIRATCGSAPTGTGSSAPLSTPAGVTTASSCQAQCEASSSCQSFVFGMVDNVTKCILYSVAASSVPKQSSTNLIAYDKACTSVPAVVPTSSNPTGAATSSSSSGSTTSSNTGSSGSNPGSTTGSSGSNTGSNTSGQHKRDTCGATPSAASGQSTPISTPANINSVADCRKACQADASCKSFEFGTMTSNGAQQCRLFSVAATSVPAPTNGQSLVVYDVGCSV
ncbi:hypothetical protein DL95DRAFT_391565 [Leptodontidium sp. 2 PMI_412]|nr:hypothetical protein DL95DRAFT_391565 [Leptodontidium sp. 2 PMI_412]